MGSAINNKINKFLCNPKNVRKRRNTRLEKCYGHVNIATALKIKCNIFCKRNLLISIMRFLSMKKLYKNAFIARNTFGLKTILKAYALPQSCVYKSKIFEQ